MCVLMALSWGRIGGTISYQQSNNQIVDGREGLSKTGVFAVAGVFT
jgi:hypothetical protein